ncbi:MAG: hypothetical protein ABIH25_05720 [Candidatus Woesearchaeota archaeon]
MVKQLINFRVEREDRIFINELKTETDLSISDVLRSLLQISNQFFILDKDNLTNFILKLRKCSSCGSLLNSFGGLTKCDKKKCRLRGVTQLIDIDLFLKNKVKNGRFDSDKTNC